MSNSAELVVQEQSYQDSVASSILFSQVISPTAVGKTEYTRATLADSPE